MKQSIYAVACFLTAVAVVPSNFALAAVFGVVGAVGSEVLRTLTAFFMVDGVLAVCSFEGDCLVDFCHVLWYADSSLETPMAAVLWPVFLAEVPHLESNLFGGGECGGGEPCKDVQV